MGKKNSGTPAASSSRGGPKRGRGSGRGNSRGFLGHKGKGRDYSGQSESINERPESAVDEVDNGSSGESES